MFEIVLGLTPAIILLGIVLWIDRRQPEPAKEIIMALLGGVGSIAICLPLAYLFGGFGIYDETDGSLVGTMMNALFSAALPEEFGKLTLLYLLVRRNKYFNEYVDGVVYAACIGLGFAGFENILYIAQSGDEAVSTALMRAVLSVPGHFLFALFMGYWFSKWWWTPEQKVGETEGQKAGNKKLYLFLTLAIPVLCHMTYDWICFYFANLEELEDVIGIITLVVLLGINTTGFVFARKRIKQHKIADSQIVEGQEEELINDYNKEDSSGRRTWGVVCNIILYILILCGIGFFVSTVVSIEDIKKEAREESEESEVNIIFAIDDFEPHREALLVDANNGDPAAMCFTAVICWEDDDDAQACEWIDKAIEASDYETVANVLNQAAYIHANNDRLERSLFVIEKAISINPNDPNLYDSRGEFLIKLDNEEEALRMWELANEMDSEFQEKYPDSELYKELKKRGRIE